MGGCGGLFESLGEENYNVKFFARYVESISKVDGEYSLFC